MTMTDPNVSYMSPEECIVHYCAINDKDGNPRRVYVHWRNYAPVRSYDEGYKGFHAIPEELRSLPRYDRTVSVGLYKDFLRMYR